MGKNKHLIYLGLSLLSALLLSIAWQPYYLLPAIFVAFVPLFILEKRIRQEQRNARFWILLYGWICFLIWNIATVWWIWEASAGGAIAAFVINSLPMVLPIFLYHVRAEKTGKAHLLYFIALWLSVEMLQFHWDFAFPWLILGNVFSYLPQSVQWYSFTGVLGGSLWVLWVNKEVYEFIEHKQANRIADYKAYISGKIFKIILIPLFTSVYLLYNNQPHAQQQADIMVVQPNIDPYSEKFSGVSAEEQLIRMLELAAQHTDSNLQYILLPETALQGGLLENQLPDEQLIQILRQFLNRHPYLTIISGMDSYRILSPHEKKPVTARKFSNSNQYFDAYNAALQINTFDSMQVYHKNKLVPGVEKMPYPALFKFLEKFALDLGGTSGSLGSDGEATVFQTRNGFKMAPIICYESVFPDFTASYTEKGADVLCILTNDGWWGNTPGYKQHFEYARLRAIENHRAIARSANTGISGFIDANGTPLQKSEWWTPCALRMKVPVYTDKTFFVSYGNWLGWIFVIIALADSAILFILRRQQ